MAGSIFGLAVAASQPGFFGQVQFASILWIFLGAFFSAAAFVDARTFWAPDELVLPCCILAGSIGSAGGEVFWYLQGPVFGFALWGVGRIAWQLQIVLGLRFLPPPDVAAFAMPLVLFGLDIRSAIAYLGCAAVLSGIGIYRSRRLRACGPFQTDLLARNFGGRVVPFLGIAFPVNMIAGLLP